LISSKEYSPRAEILMRVETEHVSFRRSIPEREECVKGGHHGSTSICGTLFCRWWPAFQVHGC